MKRSSSQLHLMPFELPDPAVARHPNVLLSQRVTRQWLDELPFGNPPGSAQQALQQVRMLVRDPEPGRRLTSLLDCYLPSVERLTQIIETRLPADTDSALPLDQLEGLVLELVNELACGYLRASNEQLVVGRFPPLATLYKAMRLLDLATTLASLHYHRPPKPAWKRLLHTYRLAEQLQIARQPVDPKNPAGDGSDTIQGMFFAALLTACCDPHHHQPGQVRSWHDWLLRHTSELSLVPRPEGDAPIAVDISGELAPLTAARVAGPGADTRYLTIDRVLAELRADESAPQALVGALTEVVRGRQKTEQRRAPRQPSNQPYHLLLGLYNVVQRLLALNGGEAMPTVATPGRQMNQSRTGAAFTLPSAPRAPLSVGEPLLAEAEARDERGGAVGFLARIQRLVMVPGRPIEIGVEKLPGRAMPVHLTGTAAERARGDTEALLIHAIDTNTYTLIASRRIFREGDLVTVEGSNVRHNLRMIRCPSGCPRLAYIEVEVSLG